MHILALARAHGSLHMCFVNLVKAYDWALYEVLLDDIQL